MDVRFVGSGDAFGSGGRFQTCMWLHGEGLTVLVDCGATSLTALQAQNLNPGAVDVVVISHLHGDHFGGLPFLILDGQFTRRTKPLTVLGPRGTARRLKQAMETLFPGSTAVDRRFQVPVVELDADGSDRALGPLTVRSWQVDHASGAPALAVQVHLGGDVFGYSGDTAWTPALVDAARDTDLFVCEAYTHDRPVRFHLDHATLDRHSDKFETRRLILTHMGPTMLARLDAVRYETAYDGLVITA